MARPILFIFLSVIPVFSQQVGARYLIITHDTFYDAIIPFARWKHKMGYKTKIVRVPSELAQNATAIRNYILNAYNTWQIKPEFILFVGAPNYIPWSLSSTPYGDNNYTNMDGDIYNEIISGRLNVHDITEAQTVVAKMLKYERNPDISDPLWFKSACTIVRDIQDDDSITYRLDAEYAAGRMVNNGYVKVDTFFASRGANANSVINATNLGRGFVLYRGTAINNWYTPFAVNPDILSNGNKLPIVLSITCGTLGTGSTPTTAERWFLTGSSTNLRGAAGYFATTTVITGGAHLRSAVARGFFDGIFLYKKKTFGEACEEGRLRVYNAYGATNEYRGFTTIGDPAMMIWTDTPKQMTVDYDSILHTGMNETLFVSVKHQGTPVESACVCIMFDTLIYQTGWTDAYGKIIFVFSVLDTGTMHLTVTGRNLYPFEGVISIRHASVYLIHQGNILKDTLGNGNGNVDPGETVLLRAKIKNIGATSASRVRAILRTNDSMVVIPESISFYGDIHPGWVSQGLNPFVFTISPKTHQHFIPFELLMYDGNDSLWMTTFTIMTTGTVGGGNGTGPDPYGYYIYDDTDTLTGNAPVYDWFEIAPSSGGPGIIIPEISNADDDTVTLPLPFNFTFYGITYDSIGICSNGFLELSKATYRFGDNMPIPSQTGPRRLIAPLWDDFDLRPPPDGNGDVYWYYDTLNHRVIFEFKECKHYGIIPLQETFQVILLDPTYYPTHTGDGQILMMYASIDNSNSCTIGIEDETETARGLQYVYNNVYAPDAMPIQNRRALLITTKPSVFQHSPWINLTHYAINDSAGGNNNGIPEPNETIELTLYLKNDGDTIVTNLNGILRTQSTSLILIDSIADFGNIGSGATGDNATNPYTIQISGQPIDTFVGVVVHLSGNNGNYTTSVYLTMRIHYEVKIEERTNSQPAFCIPQLEISPNPFRHHLKIRWQITNNRRQETNKFPLPIYPLSLAIYDIAGRLVKLFNHSTNHQSDEIIWFGYDNAGRELPAGVYFIELKYGKISEVKKVIMLK
ncbi:MAG: C25 family cysteine peptidase [candidate division WOR-3 bacterium]|nr:C25 family cysteine peptidase [candidate division WOR-3 bacterium]